MQPVTTYELNDATTPLAGSNDIAPAGSPPSFIKLWNAADIIYEDPFAYFLCLLFLFCSVLTFSTLYDRHGHIAALKSLCLLADVLSRFL